MDVSQALLLFIVLAPGVVFSVISLLWLVGWVPTERVLSATTGMVFAASVFALAAIVWNVGAGPVVIKFGDWFAVGQYQFPLVLMGDRLSLPFLGMTVVLADGTVAGNVVYWEAAGEPNIAYWLGKAHWGKGIASAALAQFLTKIEARPVYAHVAKHNFASIRVLQKCGFQLARKDMSDDGEELVMELRSDRCATAANKPTKT